MPVGVLSLLRFLVLAALVAFAVYCVKAIYDDQVAIRDKVIAETVHAAAAEQRAQALNVTVTAQAARTRELEAELKAAREAVAGVNQAFGEIRKEQQRTMSTLKQVAGALETRPAPEVAAAANAATAELGKAFEETYP